MQVMIRCKVRPAGAEASLEQFDEPPVLTMLHEVGSYGFR